MSSVPTRGLRQGGSRYAEEEEDNLDTAANGGAASDSDDSDAGGDRKTAAAAGQDDDVETLEPAAGALERGTISGNKRLKRGGSSKDDSDVEFVEPIGSEQDENEDVNSGEGAAAPPAPRNPFARGGSTFSSPVRKKRKVRGSLRDLLENIDVYLFVPSCKSRRRYFVSCGGRPVFAMIVPNSMSLVAWPRSSHFCCPMPRENHCGGNYFADSRYSCEQLVLFRRKYGFMSDVARKNSACISLSRRILR